MILTGRAGLVASGIQGSEIAVIGIDADEITASAFDAFELCVKKSTEASGIDEDLNAATEDRVPGGHGRAP